MLLHRKMMLMMMMEMVHGPITLKDYVTCQGRRQSVQLIYTTIKGIFNINSFGNLCLSLKRNNFLFKVKAVSGQNDAMAGGVWYGGTPTVITEIMFLIYIFSHPFALCKGVFSAEQWYGIRDCSEVSVL